MSEPSTVSGSADKRFLEAPKQTLLTTSPADAKIFKALSYGTMEKLLLEAQKEWSRNSSRIGSNEASASSSRSSPKSPRSPINEVAGVNLVDAQVPAVQICHTSLEKAPAIPRNKLVSSTTSEFRGLPLCSRNKHVQEETQTTDWIWDWSSRPEIIPPSEMSGPKCRQPTKQIVPKVNGDRTMTFGSYSVENLPIVFLTHACTFFLGAAVMFVYLKKYCGWSSLILHSAD